MLSTARITWCKKMLVPTLPPQAEKHATLLPVWSSSGPPEKAGLCLCIIGIAGSYGKRMEQA